MVTVGKKAPPNNWIITSLPVLKYSLDIQGDPLVVETVQSLHTEK